MGFRGRGCPLAGERTRTGNDGPYMRVNPCRQDIPYAEIEQLLEEAHLLIYQHLTLSEITSEMFQTY